MNQRIALTKKLLKNSLIEMLQSQNIYEISIRELCLNAGINRSTFYKYYGSQFDLLSEMEQDLLVNIGSTLDVEVGYSRNVLEQILDYLEENIDFVRLLFNSNVDPEFPKKLFSLEPIHRMIGTLKSDMNEEECEYYDCFILYGAYETIRRWINKENREEHSHIASMLFKFIMN